MSSRDNDINPLGANLPLAPSYLPKETDPIIATGTPSNKQTTSTIISLDSNPVIPQTDGLPLEPDFNYSSKNDGKTSLGKICHLLLKHDESSEKPMFPTRKEFIEMESSSNLNPDAAKAIQGSKQYEASKNTSSSTTSSPPISKAIVIPPSPITNPTTKSNNTKTRELEEIVISFNPKDNSQPTNQKDKNDSKSTTGSDACCGCFVAALIAPFVFIGGIILGVLDLIWIIIGWVIQVLGFIICLPFTPCCICLIYLSEWSDFENDE